MKNRHNGGDNDQLDAFIEAARQRVMLDPANATDRDFNLVIAGYLATKIEKTRSRLVRVVAVPFWVAGALFVAFFEGARLFFTR